MDFHRIGSLAKTEMSVGLCVCLSVCLSASVTQKVQDKESFGQNVTSRTDHGHKVVVVEQGEGGGWCRPGQLAAQLAVRCVH